MNARLEPSVRFAPATPERLPEIARLLAEVKLLADDLSATNLAGFEMAADVEERIIGVAGIECLGRDALLRSVAVVPDWRRRGLAGTLVARCESAAHAAGIETIYLLTTDAGDYFRRLGYTEIAREDVPPAVTAHAQFRSLCPASAVCLRKRLQ